MPTSAGRTASQPVADATDAYAPYGQLVTMLFPRVGGMAIYDAAGALLWSSDGFRQFDFKDLAQPAEAESRASASSTSCLNKTSAGAIAFVHRVRTLGGKLLGSVIVEFPGEGDRPLKESMITSLMRPVLQCMQSRMELERTVVEQAQEKKQDVELLLSVDEDRTAGVDDLDRLLEHSVEHFDCAMGALLIPDKGVTLCRGRDGATADSSLLNRTHKHLLAWVQLNNKPMIVNHIATGLSDPNAHKILSCPLRDIDSRVAGLIALFRSAHAPDFEPRDARMLELIGRRAVAVLASQQDALTGLADRPSFERCVQRVIDKPEARGALLYIDMDRLRLINETFGFQVGDEVLQRVADLLRSEGTREGFIARVGGDRFAVFLSGKDEAAAYTAAERLRSAISGLEYSSGERGVAVSASIGVASAERAQPVAHSLACAELACKRAKQQGSGRVQVHTSGRAPEVGDAAERSTLAVVEEALRRSSFELEAQIVRSLADAGSVLGYETLLRLRNGQDQLIAADKFLQAAERHRLTPALDRWVVSACLDELRRLESALSAPPWRVMLNVSAHSLFDGQFLEFLTDALEGSSLAAALCFELQEATALGHPEQTARFVAGAREVGCAVALDDFGRSSASLAELQRLPVSYLKIDGTLVRSLLSDPAADAMVAAIAQAARALRVPTIAKHVENAKLAGRLVEIGIDYGQGFFFEPPRSLTELADELAQPQPARAAMS